MDIFLPHLHFRIIWTHLLMKTAKILILVNFPYHLYTNVKTTILKNNSLKSCLRCNDSMLYIFRKPVISGTFSDMDIFSCLIHLEIMIHHFIISYTFIYKYSNAQIEANMNHSRVLSSKFVAK